MHDSGDGDADDGDDELQDVDVNPLPSLSSPAVGKRSCEDKGSRMNDSPARRRTPPPPPPPPPPLPDEDIGVEAHVVGSGSRGGVCAEGYDSGESNEESDNDHHHEHHHHHHHHQPCPRYYHLACVDRETGMTRETLEAWRNWEGNPGTPPRKSSGRQEEEEEEEEETVVVAVAVAVGKNGGEESSVEEEEEDRTAKWKEEEEVGVGKCYNAYGISGDEYESERVEGKGTERLQSEPINAGRRGSETEPGGGRGGGGKDECTLEDKSVTEDKSGIRNVEGEDDRNYDDDEIEICGEQLETQVIEPSVEEETCLRVESIEGRGDSSGRGVIGDSTEEKCSKFVEYDIFVDKSQHDEVHEKTEEDSQNEREDKNLGTEIERNGGRGRGGEVDKEDNNGQVDKYDCIIDESETIKAYEIGEDVIVETGRRVLPTFNSPVLDTEDILDDNANVANKNIVSATDEWINRKEMCDGGRRNGGCVETMEREEKVKVINEIVAKEGGDEEDEECFDLLNEKKKLSKEVSVTMEMGDKIMNWEREEEGIKVEKNVEENIVKEIDLVTTSFEDKQIENRGAEKESNGIPMLNSENIVFDIRYKNSCESSMIECPESIGIDEMVEIEKEKKLDHVYSEKLELQKDEEVGKDKDGPEVLSFYYYPRDRLPSFHSARRTDSKETPVAYFKSRKENCIARLCEGFEYCNTENRKSEKEIGATRGKEEGLKNMEVVDLPIEKDIRFDERWLDTMKSMGGETAPIGFDYEGEMEKVLFECKHLEVIFDKDISGKNSEGENEYETSYETCGTCGRGFKRTKVFDDLESYAALQSSISSLKDKKKTGGLSDLFLGCFTAQNMGSGVKDKLASEETTEPDAIHKEGWKETSKERNIISRIKDKSSPVKITKDPLYSGKKKISLPVDRGKEFVDNKRKTTYIRRRFKSLSQIFTIATKTEPLKIDDEDLCNYGSETQVNGNTQCSEESPRSTEGSILKARGRRKRSQRPTSCIEVGNSSPRPESQGRKKYGEEELPGSAEPKGIRFESEGGPIITISSKPVGISRKPNRRRTRRPKSCGDIDYYSATCTFILESGFDQIDSNVSADRIADKILVTPAKYNKRHYDTQGEQQVQYSPHRGNKTRPLRHRAFSLGMEDVNFRLPRSPNMLWDWLNRNNSVRMDQKDVGNDARSIYRRGARRWRKLYKVNGHTFQAKRFNRRAFCAICKDRIWGLGRQGFKCIQCKLLVHKKCHKLQSIPCNQFDTSTDTLGSNDSTLSRPGANGKVAMPDYNCNAAAAVAAAAVASVVPDPGMSEETQVELPANKEAVTGTTSGGAGQYCLDDFELIRVIGRGSYAKVLMVELKRTRRIYAMKVIKKTLVTDDEDIDWVQTEKHVFETASNHPFLVGLHSCFQTPSRLFFVIEFVRGGDLMFHMQRQRRLPEEHARFYAAEICLALNFLHEKGIIYRDLKLDNVLLDHEGHIKLTDYGMCKEGIRPGDTTSTFCGTPNYIAPEILQGVEYSFSVDWWALGVLMFEMLAGKSPFDIVGANDNPDCNTEDFLFQVILERPIRIPRSLSLKAASILKGFLNKNPMDRLGCHPETGFQDIVTHQFFKNIEWELLEQRQVSPPYRPRLDSDRDLANFPPEFTDEPIQLTPDDAREIDVIDQSEFEGFEYVNPLLMSMEDCV